MNYELAKAELTAAYYAAVLEILEAAHEGATRLELLKARYDLDLAHLEVKRLKAQTPINTTNSPQ